MGLLVDGCLCVFAFIIGSLYRCPCAFVCVSVCLRGKLRGLVWVFWPTWWTLYVGGSSRDEKAVAMVIGDKGLESTVAPASIYLQQFIEFLMFNMVEVLRLCPSKDLCVGARVA